MHKKRVTMTEIARLAGLSIASVSRVIHTPHLTSQKTQEQVNQAIKKLNYHAQFAFKAAETRHKNKKLLVIDNQLLPNSQINKGIEQSVKQQGYKLLYLQFLYFSEYEVQQIVSYTINHHVDGILIINDSPYLATLLQFSHALPPIVLVNYFSMKFPCVYFDHLSISYQATNHLLAQGHNNIAILLSDNNTPSSHYLEQGYLQALSRYNITKNNNNIIRNSGRYHQVKSAIKRRFSQPNPPSALICTDRLCLNYSDASESLDNTSLPNEMIYGVLNQCRDLRLHLPSQLSVLYFSHHKTNLLHHELNYLSAMYKPLFLMGESAVELVLSIIQSNCYARMSKLIDCQLIERHSVVKTH